MTNWKTTILGIAGVLVALATIWCPPQYQGRIAVSTSFSFVNYSFRCVGRHGYLGDGAYRSEDLLV